MRWAAAVCGLMAVGWIAPASAASLPACASNIVLSNVAVARVQEGGTLVLADGHKLHLAEVLLATKADAALSTLAGGKRIVAAASMAELDRYGVVGAQIFLPGGDWLQIAMLRQGLARAYFTPDEPDCADALYAAEQQARAARAGIWADPANAVRTPETIRWRDTGTFQIVEGKVVSANVKGARAYLDFGADWKTDFTATIPPDAMKLFAASGIDPSNYAGKTIRVRGWIDEYHGPEIEIAAPGDVEVVK